MLVYHSFGDRYRAGSDFLITHTFKAMAVVVAFMMFGCSSDQEDLEGPNDWTRSRVEKWRNEPYPSLGDTPARPSISSLEERRELLEQLEHDRSAGTSSVPDEVQ